MARASAQDEYHRRHATRRSFVEALKARVEDENADAKVRRLNQPSEQVKESLNNSKMQPPRMTRDAAAFRGDRSEKRPRHGSSSSRDPRGDRQTHEAICRLLDV